MGARPNQTAVVEGPWVTEVGHLSGKLGLMPVAGWSGKLQDQTSLN